MAAPPWLCFRYADYPWSGAPIKDALLPCASLLPGPGETLKAIVLREFGGPEVLKLEDVPTPAPGPGEILVKVHAVSVNVTLDIAVRKGLYRRKPPFPHVLGVDPTGEVAALGAGVSRHRVGSRVSVHTVVPSPRATPGHEADDPVIGSIIDHRHRGDWDHA